MALRKKHFVANGIYFITFTICKWVKIFTQEKYYQLIFKWFDYQKQKYENKIHGFVIMPNHFHGLIYISEKSPPISKLIQNAKRFLAYDIVKFLKEDSKKDLLDLFAEKARKEKGSKYKVFEERYDAKIIDNEDLFWQKLNYIHNNHCKSGLCDLPENYIYSSASNYILGEGIYGVDLIM